MRHSSLSRLVALTACLSLSAALVPRVVLAAPTAAEQATARAATESGLSKRALGDHAGALESFAAAHALMGTPATGLEVAREQGALGLVLEAHDTALGVAESAAIGEENDRAKAEARALSASLAPRIASIVITLRGVAAGTAIRLRIDGAEIPSGAVSGPLRVNPGARTIQVEADGYVGVRQTVQIAPSITARIEALLMRSEPDSGSPKDDAAGAAAGSANTVHKGVLPMIGKAVVLRTRSDEMVTGRLLSANGDGYSLEQPDHRIVLVPRQMARGLRLEERAPDPAPGQLYRTWDEYKQAHSDVKPETKGTGKIIGGSILTAHSIPLIISGIVNATARSNGSAEDVQVPAGVAVTVIGGFAAVVGLALIASGATDRAESTKSAWVGAPGGSGWRWQF